ncbi:MAG: glycosyltransferase [Acidobacteriia bacterium]|nr:glycosyltransferase [Terriglobia bacterium]
MKILVSGQFYPDSFARNIAVTARRMGHKVMVVEETPIHRRLNVLWAGFWTIVPRLFPKYEQRRQGKLVRAAEEFAPDMILLSYGTLPPSVVRQLRSTCSARIAAWYPDHLVNLGRQYLLASDLDAWFLKDPYMVRVFRDKLALNAFYLPEACNSLWHRRVELSIEDRRKYGCDLVTASNMYYYRAKSLEIFANYDMKIWGKSYPAWLSSPLRVTYQDEYVAEKEKAKAFTAAKIVLNTMHYGEIEGVNCRLFEAAGCGAFQIADWKPALPDLFEPEKEIVTFRTQQELREKVDYYLAHPEERREIADRAYAHAHNEHTYEMRLQRMFEILGLHTQRLVEVGESQTL